MMMNDVQQRQNPTTTRIPQPMYPMSSSSSSSLVSPAMSRDTRNNDMSDRLLADLTRRVEQVCAAYRARGGVFPRSFTGSVSDLRVVAQRSSGGNNSSSIATTFDANCSTAAGRPAIKFYSNNLDSFNDQQLNEWTRIFQEYWLTMLKTANELRKLAADQGAYKCAAKTDPVASKTFLSMGNLPYARLALERILLVFEEDMRRTATGATTETTEMITRPTNLATTRSTSARSTTVPANTANNNNNNRKNSSVNDSNSSQLNKFGSENSKNSASFEVALGAALGAPLGRTTATVGRASSTASDEDTTTILTNDPIFSRLSFENKYLARRFLDRTPLD